MTQTIKSGKKFSYKSSDKCFRKRTVNFLFVEVEETNQILNMVVLGYFQRGLLSIHPKLIDVIYKELIRL
jgi:hypothetical protein